uniref:Uncharacterized protein n=1 Tax=Setaria italica TaxID=4555 RepID=K3YNR2_SETIT
MLNDLPFDVRPKRGSNAFGPSWLLSSSYCLSFHDAFGCKMGNSLLVLVSLGFL